jgi:hypothetical protein
MGGSQGDTRQQSRTTLEWVERYMGYKAVVTVGVFCSPQGALVHVGTARYPRVAVSLARPQSPSKIPVRASEVILESALGE